jgi:SnoaL-like protein
MSRRDEQQELIDRQHIVDAIHLYCRGVDRLDRELINSVYHPDAWDDHGTFKARGAECAAIIVDRVRRQSKSSMHCITNIIVELRGDSADTEAYFVAWLAFDRGQQAFIRALGGRYVDTFERRDGTWRIASRTVVHEWSRIDPIAEAWPPGSGMHEGKRSRDDIIYTRTPVARPAFVTKIYGEPDSDAPGSD